MPPHRPRGLLPPGPPKRTRVSSTSPWKARPTRPPPAASPRRERILSGGRPMSMSEDTFISHLMELRDRILRSLIAVAVAMAALAIWPGIGGVLDLLAWPMIES